MLGLHVVILARLAIPPFLVLRLHRPAVRQPTPVVRVTDPFQTPIVGEGDELEPIIAGAVGVEGPIGFGAGLGGAAFVLVHFAVRGAFPDVETLGESGGLDGARMGRFGGIGTVAVVVGVIIGLMAEIHIEGGWRRWWN